MGWTDTEQERLDLADFLEGLPPAAWDSMTPRHGWRVRDVAAHVIQGATQSRASTVVGLAGRGFRYNAYYDDTARENGCADTETLVAGVRAAAPSRRHMLGLPGPASAAMLAETFEHHQSLRHHLGEPRSIPPERLVIALDVAAGAGFPLGARKRIAGLHLSATDVGWQTGDGPEVRGPAEQLFFAMLGRAEMVDRLDGDGWPELSTRL